MSAVDAVLFSAPELVLAILAVVGGGLMALGQWLMKSWNGYLSRRMARRAWPRRIEP